MKDIVCSATSNLTSHLIKWFGRKSISYLVLCRMPVEIYTSILWQVYFNLIYKKQTHMRSDCLHLVITLLTNNVTGLHPNNCQVISRNYINLKMPVS